MARKIFISSDMSVDEALLAAAEEDSTLALFWPWLLTSLDDWGRGYAEPRRVKSRLFPDWPGLSWNTTEDAIALFAKHGLITVYEVDGKRYMAVNEAAWRKYQTHIRYDRKGSVTSQFPAPDGIPEVPGSARSIQDVPGVSGSCIPSPSPSPSASKDAATTAASKGEDILRAYEALPCLPGYQPRDGDIEWLVRVRGQHPRVNLANEIYAYGDWYETKAKKSPNPNWKSGMNNWLKNAKPPVIPVPFEHLSEFNVANTSAN